MAKFFKRRQFTSAEIRRRTKEAGKKLSVILHGKTRFVGVYYVLKVSFVVTILVASSDHL